MTVLEALYAARATLADDEERYAFSNWSCCTCGHVYQAALGERGSGMTVSCSKDELYEATLRAIVEASGLRVPITQDHAVAVSQATMRFAESRLGWPYDDDEFDRVARGVALALVERAIQAEEQKQEDARRRVLAEAASVVNAVRIEPELVLE